jgi:hypothetical protein
MIKIEEYPKFANQTFGLGQDVSHDLTDVVKVAALFVKKSKIHSELVGIKKKSGKLKKVTLDAGAPQYVYDQLLSALENDELTKRQLISLTSKLGRKHFASGLIRAIFKGQKSVAIVDWAAQSYLSLAIGLGLVDLNYSKNYYFITKLGRKAVQLFDENKTKKLRSFMLDRLYEYPYAAWLIRVVNKNKKVYTKFDLGENFGFIDEPGFISLPEDLYVQGIFQAKSKKDSEEVKNIRECFESTSDKYMRWLAGVLVNYGLLEETTRKYSKKINNKKYTVSLKAYKVTYKGIKALNKVNGGSSTSRSIKRIRWEYLAPKMAKGRKTSRALMLKFLSENKKGISASDLSKKINEIQPSINSIPDQVIDDAKGLNRIGIEIDTNGGKLILKEKLFDFIIPIKKNFTFQSSKAEQIKKAILPSLKELDHKYLQAIDIAYKKKTTNAENTLLEILSTDLFINEIGFKGSHLGGSNKPDGFIYNKAVGFILDSKAYSSGFAVTKKATDAMGRYIVQYKNRNDGSDWWISIPKNIPKTYFIYVSSYYIGNYKSQLKDFEERNEMRGGLVEIAKLILITEKVKQKELDMCDVINNLLDDKISWNEYSKDFI